MISKRMTSHKIIFFKIPLIDSSVIKSSFDMNNSSNLKDKSIKFKERIGCSGAK